MTAMVLWVNPWGLALVIPVAVALTIASRSYVGLRQRYGSLQLLYGFTRTVAASIKADAVADSVLSEARKLLRAAKAEIILLDEQTGLCSHRLINRERSNDKAEPSDGDISVSDLDDEPVWLDVVRRRRPTMISRHSRHPAELSYLAKVGASDCVVAPLLVDGQVVGAIMVMDRLSNISSFDDEDLQLFATLANHASVAFENGRLVEELRREADERRYEALHDSLTGLANRTLFLQRVGECLVAGGRREADTAAVMLMDLDRFKEVNDTLGHHNGDLLLREVASRLSKTLRNEDTVARLGGDEFAILLPRLTCDDAVDAAERIVRVLQKPFHIDELSVDVGASIGIALCPRHGDAAAVLLQRADVAMYEAKGSDRSIALYSPDRDLNNPERLTLATDLRHAIAAGQMTVHYQPKVRLCDGRVVGAEALVRWQHPERGVIGPDEFIPTAEQTGLIVPLTLFMLRSSLDQCRRWCEDGFDLGISVNLSVRSLVDTDLPDQIDAVLAETGVDSGLLTLEVTESSVMADPPRAIAVLKRLCAAGVQLSVDDFGTGYSSLSYLRRLPVHEVKVDKSFVCRLSSDSSDAAIVQSIIELGHNLGLRTVAEGVEDWLSCDLLRTMGCDQAQGYHWSKPIPAATLTRWLRAAQPHPEVTGAAQHRPMGSATVLIVDDDRSLRRVIRNLLIASGRFLVHEAGDGHEAIAMARRHQPDVVLLDVSMPIMGGLDAIPGIRAAAPTSKILVISALGDQDIADLATRHGAIGYLDKTLDLGELPDRLGLALVS